MCGIVGYLGYREAYPILIKGLKRLEYRGYDSAGVALLDGGDIRLYKSKGKVSALEAVCADKNTNGNIGIAHTRWATHGEPSDVNAHPHYSQSESLALIHNGIIENYMQLKQQLLAEGYTFRSQTDTEVLVQFIEYVRKKNNLPLVEAVREALSYAVGAYAIGVVDRNNPDMLIAARRSSPLVVGIGDDEFFIASDATPIVEYTNKVVYLEDGDIALIRRGKPLQVCTVEDTAGKDVSVSELSLSLSQLEKGDYAHYMLKEIYEQSHTIQSCLSGRVNIDHDKISISGFIDHRNAFVRADRIIIIACGTSWHAALVAKYAFEEYARIPAEVDYASEFRYRKPVLSSSDIVIAISQSGETADTLAALELAKQAGAFTFGICNVVGSSIARATDSGCYTHVGPEIGVASTKAFTGQLAVLTLLALELANLRGTIANDEYVSIIRQISSLPGQIDEILLHNAGIEQIAAQYQSYSDFLYLGRGYLFPIALEGALKLKEISYIHAEGYPAAEMKHGPIALISEQMPVVVLATKSDLYEKVISNIQEIKARKAPVIAVVSEGDQQVRAIADYVIEIPATAQLLTPILAVVPLQLLAYHIAVYKGCNVDQPRNLAKSVTVE